jgi:hypothetical protein
LIGDAGDPHLDFRQLHRPRLDPMDVENVAETRTSHAFGQHSKRLTPHKQLRWIHYAGCIVVEQQATRDS